MAAPKIKANHLGKLFSSGEQHSPLQEKKIIESLIERLNEKIEKDPTLQKKAALIIEAWIKQPPKKNK